MPERNCESRAFRWFGILAALVWLGAPRVADARTWTDSQGNKISATYERVQGEEVVLKRGFDVIRVPLAKLSAEDREFVQEKLKASGARIWSDLKGRQIVARPQRMHEGKIELKSKDQVVTVPFSRLTYEDQEFVREWLAGRNESALLPKPEEKSRVWTDETGRRVMARLESVERGGTLHLRSYGIDIPITFDKLSAADQEYLRKQLIAEGKADLLLPPPVQVAVAPPARVATAPPSAAPLRPYVSPVPPPPPPPPRPQLPYTLPPTPEYRIERYKVCLDCGRKLPDHAQVCDHCVNKARNNAFDGRGNSTYNTAYRAGQITGYCVLIALALSGIGFVYRWVTGG